MKCPRCGSELITNPFGYLYCVNESYTFNLTEMKAIQSNHVINLEAELARIKSITAEDVERIYKKAHDVCRIKCQNNATRNQIEYRRTYGEGEIKRHEPCGEYECHCHADEKYLTTEVLKLIQEGRK